MGLNCHGEGRLPTLLPHLVSYAFKKISMFLRLTGTERNNRWNNVDTGSKVLSNLYNKQTNKQCGHRKQSAVYNKQTCATKF